MPMFCLIPRAIGCQITQTKLISARSVDPAADSLLKTVQSNLDKGVKSIWIAASEQATVNISM